MKKIKLLTPIVSGVSLAALAPAIVAASVNATNINENIIPKKASVKSDVNVVRPMDVQISTDSITARKYFKSGSTEVNWLDGQTASSADKSSLVSIGNSAFAYSKLQKITIPSGVKTIDPMAFYHCEDLKEIDLSLVQNNLMTFMDPTLGANAFKLGEYAFKDSGNNTEDIDGQYVFAKLDETGAKTPSSHQEYNMQMAYIKAMLSYSGSRSKWPVKTIEDGNTLTTVEIGYTALPVQYITFDTNGKVTNINLTGIDEVNGINTIIFPAFMSGFTEDGLKAFNKLKETNLIKNVFFLSPFTPTNATGITSVESEWFRGWDSLEQVVLPSTLTGEDAIGDDAFSGCSKLWNLDLSNTTITNLPDGFAENAGREVSAGLNVSLPSTITTIEEDTFTGSGIKTLTLPSTITTIKSSAFLNCDTLKKVIIPYSVTEIGEMAFAGCDNLETIVFEDTEEHSSQLQSIGAKAFENCDNLKTVSTNPITQAEGTFMLPAALGQASNAEQIGANAFATTNSKDITTFNVMNFSNIPAATAIKIKFAAGAFDGWPSKGQIVGADDWTDTTWTTVLANLQAGGLSKSWVKTTKDTQNVLNVTYDAGTKLTINPGDFSQEVAPDIQYSYSGNSTDWHVLTKGTTLELSSSYHTIYIRGNNLDGFTKAHEGGTGYERLGILQFTNATTGKGVYITGNVMGLIDNGLGTQTVIPNKHCFDKLFYGSTCLQSINSGFLNNKVTQLTENCYQAMFAGCTNLTVAPDLPCTNLAKQCYYNMFRNSGIKAMPELPATTMAANCYESMFQDCTSLATFKDFASTPTLAEYCFKNMFNGCSAMVKAPKLPVTDDNLGGTSTKAATLEKGCYYGMFSNCTNLETAPELTAEQIPQEGYMNMFAGCSKLTETPLIKAPANTSDYSYGTDCYKQMFMNCSQLNKMEVQFLTWPVDGEGSYDQHKVTTDWVSGVPQTGKFKCNVDLPHDASLKNPDQIPFDWEIDTGEEKPIDPLKPEQVNTEIGAKCVDATAVTILNFGTNTSSTKPNLEVKIVSADKRETLMDWSSIYDTTKTEDIGGFQAFKIPANCYAYFRGVNTNWSRSEDNYSSIWFYNPNATVDDYNGGYENYKNATSTHVTIFGNVMSLILKGIDQSTGKGIYLGETEVPPAYCFAGLFRGRPKLEKYGYTTTTDNYNEAKACNFYKHNYCIEQIGMNKDEVSGFLSVPSLSEGLFASAFRILPNLANGADAHSRETKGSRHTKSYAFKETYNGCKSMTTPPKVNIDCIGNSNDAKQTFRAMFIDCEQLVTSAQIPIVDISKLVSGSNTFGWMYYQCYKLQTVYLYADKPNNYSTTLHSTNGDNSIFYLWCDHFVGKNVASGTQKVVYLRQSMWTWIKSNYNSNNYGQGSSNKGAMLPATNYTDNYTVKIIKDSDFPTK